MDSSYNVIGKDVPRADAWKKAVGAALYTDDMSLPGMLHGKFLRSPVPHARIKRIDTARALNFPGVKAVITGEQTPKIRFGNWRLFPATQDETPLAVDKVRFVGDEVAAVIAVDPDIAEEALGLIEVDYEELPSVFDVDAALAENAPLLHEETKSNVSITRNIEYGELEAGFAAADYVREDTFTTQPVSHAYLEPCSSLADVDDRGRVTLWTSTQTPYIVQCLLASTLGLRENEVRVVKPFVGGGFGGKMEMRTWDFCAAFGARLTGKPVKFTLTREEELGAGKKTPSHADHLQDRVQKGRDDHGEVLSSAPGRRSVQQHGADGHVSGRELRGHAVSISGLQIRRLSRVHQQAARGERCAASERPRPCSHPRAR